METLQCLTAVDLDSSEQAFAALLDSVDVYFISECRYKGKVRWVVLTNEVLFICSKTTRSKAAVKIKEIEGVELLINEIMLLHQQTTTTFSFGYASKAVQCSALLAQLTSNCNTKCLFKLGQHSSDFANKFEPGHVSDPTTPQQAEISNLRHRIAVLSSEQDSNRDHEYDSELIRLRRDLLRSDQARFNLDREIQDIKKVISPQKTSLNDHTTSLKQQLQHQEQKLATAKEHETQLIQLQKEIRDAHDQSEDHLRSENILLRGRLSEMETEMSLVKNREQELVLSHKESYDRHTTSSNQVSKLREEFSNKLELEYTTTKQLKKQLAHSREQEQSFQKQLTDQEMNNNIEIKKLKSSITSLELSLEEAQNNQNNGIQAQIAAVEIENQNRKQHQEREASSSSKINKLQHKITLLELDLTRCQSQRDTLKDDLQSKESSYKDDIRSLKKDIASSGNDASHNKQIIQQHEQEIAYLRKRLNDDNDSGRESNREIAGRNATLESEVLRCKKDLQELKRNSQQLEEKISAAEERERMLVTSAKDSKRDASLEIAKLERQIRDQEAIHAAVEKKHIRKQRDHERDVKKLQTEIDFLQQHTTEDHGNPPRKKSLTRSNLDEHVRYEELKRIPAVHSDTTSGTEAVRRELAERVSEIQHIEEQLHKKQQSQLLSMQRIENRPHSEPEWASTVGEPEGNKLSRQALNDRLEELQRIKKHSDALLEKATSASAHSSPMSRAPSWRVSFAMNNEIKLYAPVGESLGIRVDAQKRVLTHVTKESHADFAGAASFIGRVISHVNGIETTPSNISQLTKKRNDAGCTIFRFGEFRTVTPPDDSLTESIAKKKESQQQQSKWFLEEEQTQMSGPDSPGFLSRSRSSHMLPSENKRFPPPASSTGRSELRDSFSPKSRKPDLITTRASQLIDEDQRPYSVCERCQYSGLNYVTIPTDIPADLREDIDGLAADVTETLALHYAGVVMISDDSEASLRGLLLVTPSSFYIILPGGFISHYCEISSILEIYVQNSTSSSDWMGIRVSNTTGSNRDVHFRVLRDGREGVLGLLEIFKRCHACTQTNPNREISNLLILSLDSEDAGAKQLDWNISGSDAGHVNAPRIPLIPIQRRSESYPPVGISVVTFKDASEDDFSTGFLEIGKLLPVARASLSWLFDYVGTPVVVFASSILNGIVFVSNPVSFIHVFNSKKSGPHYVLSLSEVSIVTYTESSIYLYSKSGARNCIALRNCDRAAEMLELLEDYTKQQTNSQIKILREEDDANVITTLDALNEQSHSPKSNLLVIQQPLFVKKRAIDLTNPNSVTNKKNSIIAGLQLNQRRFCIEVVTAAENESSFSGLMLVSVGSRNLYTVHDFRIAVEEAFLSKKKSLVVDCLPVPVDEGDRGEAPALPPHIPNMDNIPSKYRKNFPFKPQIHWIGLVRKKGSRDQTSDRIVAVTSSAIFVSTTAGKITRVISITSIFEVLVTSDYRIGLVIPSDYDLQFRLPTDPPIHMATIISSLTSLYRNSTGISLVVTKISGISLQNLLFLNKPEAVRQRIKTQVGPPSPPIPQKERISSL